MNKRFWIFGVGLGLCVMLGIYSCQRDPLSQDSARQLAIPAGGSASSNDPQRTLVASVISVETENRQRNDAMSAAVSTLHRYLAAVGGQDWAKADVLWSNDQPPARSGEADLRTLVGLQSLRIENGKPKALDAESVPNSLEIPVQLRAHLEQTGTTRYQGWYRLRRNVADGSWEITSASINVQSR